jgi:hypothetical protein
VIKTGQELQTLEEEKQQLAQEQEEEVISTINDSHFLEFTQIQ